MERGILSSGVTQKDKKSAANGGLAAYSVSEKPLTPDQVRRKHFSNFYPKGFDGKLRVTPLG